MNEQLQGKLVEILTGIQQATKAAGDFAMEQLPDIAQQYVAYGQVSGTARLLLFISVTSVLAYVALVKGVFNHSATVRCGPLAGAWEDGRIGCAIVGGVFGVFSLVPLLLALDNAVLVWFAPKVWLLKELATLIM